MSRGYLFVGASALHSPQPASGRTSDRFKGIGQLSVSGHAVIMGKVDHGWQNMDKVLKLFGEKTGNARRAYRRFVKKELSRENERI